MYAPVDSPIACLEDVGRLSPRIRNLPLLNRKWVQVSQEQYRPGSLPKAPTNPTRLLGAHHDDERGAMDNVRRDQARSVPGKVHPERRRGNDGLSRGGSAWFDEPRRMHGQSACPQARHNPSKHRFRKWAAAEVTLADEHHVPGREPGQPPVNGLPPQSMSDPVK